MLNTSLGCEDNFEFFNLFLRYKIWLTSERDFDYSDTSPPCLWVFYSNRSQLLIFIEIINWQLTDVSNREFFRYETCFFSIFLLLLIQFYFIIKDIIRANICKLIQYLGKVLASKMREKFVPTRLAGPASRPMM